MTTPDELREQYLLCRECGGDLFEEWQEIRTKGEIVSFVIRHRCVDCRTFAGYRAQEAQNTERQPE